MLYHSPKVIDEKTLREYKSLTNNQHTILRNHGAKYNVNAVEYYEELVIDLDKAIILSELLLNKGLNDKLYHILNVQELVFLLLYFGIGMPNHDIREINILCKDYNKDYLFDVVGRYHNHDKLEHDLNIIKDELFKLLNYESALEKTI